MNNRRSSFSLGHIGLFVLFLGGIWLLLAPTWVGFQHQHVASRVDEWSGGALVVVTVVTFFLQWAFGLSDAVRRHRENSGPID